MHVLCVALLHLNYPCFIARARAFGFSSCIAALQRATVLEADLPTARIKQ